MTGIRILLHATLWSTGALTVWATTLYFPGWRRRRGR